MVWTRTIRHCIIACALLILLPLPASAQNGRQVLQTLVNGALTEAQRHEQARREKKLRHELERLWRACGQLDVSACDAALRLPLDQENFGALQRMRDKAERWPQYVADYNLCQPPEADLNACDRALQFPYGDEADRPKIIAWRQAAWANVERQRAEERARQIEEDRQRRIAAAQEQLRRQQAERQQQGRQNPPATAVITTSITSPAQSAAVNWTPAIAILAVALASLLAWLLHAAGMLPSLAAFADFAPGEAPRESVGEAAQSPDLPPLTGHFPTDVRNALAA